MKSSVPAFKAALLARLQADPDITGTDLTVSWGDPYPDRAGAEAIFIGQTTNRALDFTCALSQANETYEVEVRVSVTGSHLEPAPWARAYELADAVAESARSWNQDTVSPLPTGAWGSVNVVMPGASTDDESLISDGKTTSREAGVTLTLHVTARI